MTRLVTPILDHVHPINFCPAFNFCESVSTCKKSVYSIHSSNTVNFRLLSHDWPHPFLTMPTPKIFNHLLIRMNLYQHAKNQLIPSVHSWDQIYSICPGEIVHLKTIQSDWLRAFWPISQEQDFSQIKDFSRNTANNKHFHCRQSSVKINHQFSP